MVELEVYAYAVTSAITLALLIAANAYILRPALVGRLRDKLFDLRRELFLLVAEKRLSATHPVYLRLRTTINGLIATAEEVSLSRLMVALIARRRYGHLYPPLTEMLSTADPELQEKLTKAHMRIGSIVFLHVLCVSPISTAAVFGAVLAKVLGQAIVKRGEAREDVVTSARTRATVKAVSAAEALSEDCGALTPAAV